MDAAASDNWHGLSIAAALEAAETDATGLSDDEAAARLVRFGPNRLAPPRTGIRTEDSARPTVRRRRGSAACGRRRSRSRFGDYLEAAAITAVLVINTSIGFLTEWRARRAMEALRELDVPRASVVRAGRLRLIDAERLVPGDVIELSAGHRVPADARLILETDLRVTEAALTGESLPVSKSADLALDASTPLADRVNMVFKGTTVVAGIGRAVVTGDWQSHGGGTHRHARGLHRGRADAARAAARCAGPAAGLAHPWCRRARGDARCAPGCLPGAGN